MGAVSDLSAPGARALLIATSTHVGSSLPDVPSARRSAEALRDRLVRVCGMPPERVRLLPDPESPVDVARAVAEEAAATATTLLVHYVGHGLWGPGGQLYLATTHTDDLVPGLAGYQAYPFAELRQALSSARATSVVVLLDCCFSGRAHVPAPSLDRVFDTPPVHGFYLLGSAEQLASAPTREEHTAFTGELIRLLDDGDPRAGAVLTLDDAHHHLFRAMRARGAPLPRRQEGGRSGQLVLAPNAAFTAVPGVRDVDGQSAGRSPYPGLEPYGEEDARYFHGRDELARRLFERVSQDGGPVLVVGASGSGKTSLVRAGLLPLVRRAPGWSSRVLTPGEHPLHRLADALGVTAGDAVPTAMAEPATVAGWVETAQQRTLVVVDQLEEMLALCPDESERTAFTTALAVLAAAERVSVVGVLRADFYAQATTYPELASSLRERQFLVAPLDPEQARAAVEGPARAAGLHLDDGLVELVLTDLGVGHRRGIAAGALPLLSHTLWATWRLRNGNRLTVRAYRETGGVDGAIARTADDTIAALDADARDAARRMLPRLVHVGTGSDSGGADTARPMDRAELMRGLDPDTAERALRALVAARLLTVDRDVARISHEALLRTWPALSRWVEADRERLGLAQRLSEDAAAWEEQRHDPSLLYRGTRLAVALERLSGRDGDALGDVAQDFLAAAATHQRRGRRIRTQLVASLVLLLVVAVAAAAMALAQRGEATAQARAASARALIATADSVRGTDPRLALRLGVAAYRLDPDGPARAALAETLSTSRYAGELPPHSEQVTALGLSADGRRLAVGTPAAVKLWDVGDDPRRPSPAGQASAGFNGAVSAVAWQPGGDLLVVGDASSVHFFSAPAGTEPRHLGDFSLSGGRVRALTWSNDGAVLLIGNNASAVLATVVDGTATITHVLPAHNQSQSTYLALSGDGRLAVVTTDGGGAQLWDVTDPWAPRALGAPLTADSPIMSVAISSDGTAVAAGTMGSSVALWDVRDRGRPRKIDTVTARFGLVAPITRISFTPDDRKVVTSDFTGAVTLTSLSTSTPVAEIDELGTKEASPDVAVHTGHLAGFVVDRARGLLLTVAAGDEVVRLWSLDERETRMVRRGVPVAAHEPGTREGTISTAERIATSTGIDGTLLVLDVAEDGTLTPRPAVRFTDRLRPTDRLGRSALAPDGRTVVTAGGTDDTESQLWDIPPTGAPVPSGEPVEHDSPAVATAWTPDGRHLVVGHEKGGITVHDVTDRDSPVQVASRETGAAVHDLVMATNIPRAAVSTSAGRVELWDFTDAGSPRSAGGVPAGSATGRPAMALSADGSLLAVGEPSGTVRLWHVADAANPEQLASWRTTTLAIIPALAFSPDAGVLATSGLLELQLWDLTDRRVPRKLGFSMRSEIVLPVSLTFRPDGATLLSQTITEVDSWDMTAATATRDKAIELACRRLSGLPLGRESWQRYLPGQTYLDTCADSPS
ncbi:hypothetical protein ACFV4N_21875 [Actinosynnema sp. NPDC059797]